MRSVYTRPDPQRATNFELALYEESAKSALDYLLNQRNLTLDTIRHFRLGYDASKNAIVIPHYKRGELISFKYRVIGEGERYIADSGTENWLFNEEGLTYAKKKGTVLIVEGEFDLMSCWQAGSKNVVSPGNGKDSYGPWLELLDNIPKVYIAYYNDSGGKEASKQMAERVGTDKCLEVLYPEDVKDANDFFKKYTKDDLIRIVTEARPYYKYQFKGMGDVVESLRYGDGNYVETRVLPDVKMREDWLVVISGKSNVGKTSYVMNMADEWTSKGMGVLVLPFERGPQVVGERFLQVKYSYAQGDFASLTDDDWDKITKDSLDLPLYFSMPSKQQAFDVIRKAKRIFNVKVCIIDHLDYMIRNSAHKEQEIGSTLQELKRLAEELKVLMIIVTHIRKIDTAGSQRAKKPGIEDLKGSASLYQDPECVAMLRSESAGTLNVDIVKNKGKMSNKLYGFSLDTGRVLDEPAGFSSLTTADDELWNSVKSK